MNNPAVINVSPHHIVFDNAEALRERSGNIRLHNCHTLDPAEAKALAEWILGTLELPSPNGKPHANPTRACAAS